MSGHSTTDRGENALSLLDRLTSDNLKLRSQRDRLREAIYEVGTECRNYPPPGCRQFVTRDMYCGGCVLREAVAEYDEAENGD